MSKNNGCASHYLTRAEIDLDALALNLLQVRSLVGKATKILAVVKANAYGHGAVTIARALEALRVDWLGVAIPAEAVQLRKSGIRTKILILGGISSHTLQDVYALDLTPVIYDYPSALMVNALGKRQGRKLPVHVKVDTGMNRLGVPWEETEDFFVRLCNLDHLEIEGVLSHFSSAHASDAESRDFTLLQSKRFESAIRGIQRHGFSPPLIHMSNSSAIMGGIVPELSMVRAGLMLYGAYPSRDVGGAIPLKPVMTLKTSIVQLKPLPVGSPVSYSRTFYTARESKIATLAIGYGDGYHYRLSNKGKVLVKGREAPVVGSVCMDLTMIDVTEIPDAREGDEAILFGYQEGSHIPVEEVAEWVGTIPYEVLCGISSRVPRRYKKQGNFVDTE